MSQEPNHTDPVTPPAAAADSVEREELELKFPDEAANPKELGLWAGVLVLLALVVFWPATSGKFIFRDSGPVADNIRLARPGGMGEVWASRWQQPETYPFAVYQPMAFTAAWLEYRFEGHGPPTPFAFHVGNILFHAGAAVLLWLVLRELKVPGNWLAAALFALHPLASEPVSWIADQALVLAGLLMLGSIYLYLLFVKYRELDLASKNAGGAGIDPAQTWGCYGGSVLLFVLAVLSHPAVSLFPIILLLLIWWRGRAISQDLLLVAPWLLVSAVLWLAAGDLHAASSENTLWHRGPVAQLAVIGQALLSVWRIIVPISLTIFPAPAGSSMAVVGGILLLICGGLIAAGWSARQRGGIALVVVIAVYLLLQIPSLNYFDPVRKADFTMASSYLAAIPVITGITAAVVITLRRRPTPLPAPTLITATTIVLVVMGILSFVHAKSFESPVVFWTTISRQNPQSAIAQAQLAEQYRIRAVEDAASGDTDQSKEDLQASEDAARAALAIDPHNGQAQRTWANVLVARGDVQASLSHFAAAVQIDPTDFEARDEYGSALVVLGKFAQSIPQLDEALRIQPMSAITHRLLGQSYAGRVKSESQLAADDKTAFTARAVNELQQAAELNPSDLTTWQYLAEQQAVAGQTKDAIQSYLRVLSDPNNQNNAQLWLALGKLYDKQSDFKDAATCYDAALKKDKSLTEAAAALDTDNARLKAIAATQPTTAATTAPATAP